METDINNPAIITGAVGPCVVVGASLLAICSSGTASSRAFPHVPPPLGAATPPLSARRRRPLCRKLPLPHVLSRDHHRYIPNPSSSNSVFAQAQLFVSNPCTLNSLSTLHDIRRPRLPLVVFPSLLVDSQESYVFKPVGLSIIDRCGTN
jgi:hypothetical protein